MEEDTSNVSASENKKAPINNGELPRIRTYAADMSKVIKSRGETLASIVNKERTNTSTKREEPTKKPWSPKRIAFIAGTIILVLAGIGVLMGVFVFSPRDEIDVQTTGIIFANETYTVSPGADGLLIDQLAVARRSQNLALGEVMRIDLVENGFLVDGQEFARRLGIPSALAREVKDIMVGIHSFDRNQPFIILRVSTYDRSFAAMLAWEREIGRTLSSFFAPTGAVGAVPLLSFTDEIIQNTDVRISGSEWPILYTFTTQDLLIITTNEFTLREIMTRLSSTRTSF